MDSFFSVWDVMGFLLKCTLLQETGRSSGLLGQWEGRMWLPTSPQEKGDHLFPHPIPLPAMGSSLLAGRPPCPAPQAGQQTGGHPHGAGTPERRNTVRFLEAGGGRRITSGVWEGQGWGTPPFPHGLGSSKAPAAASSGHQGAPRPLPPLPLGPGGQGIGA